MKKKQDNIVKIYLVNEKIWNKFIPLSDSRQLPVVPLILVHNLHAIRQENFFPKFSI